MDLENNYSQQIFHIFPLKISNCEILKSELILQNMSYYKIKGSQCLTLRNGRQINLTRMFNIVILFCKYVSKINWVTLSACKINYVLIKII